MSTNNTQAKVPAQTSAEREKSRKFKDSLWAAGAITGLAVAGGAVGYYLGRVSMKSE